MKGSETLSDGDTEDSSVPVNVDNEPPAPVVLDGNTVVKSEFSSDVNVVFELSSAQIGVVRGVSETIGNVACRERESVCPENSSVAVIIGVIDEIITTVDNEDACNVLEPPDDPLLVV